MKAELLATAQSLMESPPPDPNALPFPMLLASYLVGAAVLAAGGTADAVASIAGQPTILGQTELPLTAQYGLAGLFLAGFCYAAKLILQYHTERVRELTEEKGKLIARIQELQREKDADFRRQLDEAKKHQ